VPKQKGYHVAQDWILPFIRCPKQKGHLRLSAHADEKSACTIKLFFLSEQERSGRTSTGNFIKKKQNQRLQDINKTEQTEREH